MREISEREILERFNFDNPWWSESVGIDPEFRSFPERAYLPLFKKLVLELNINRAVILMGPRRVGKTVMVYQTIQHLLDSGVPGKNIVYMSLETPIYTGLGLEKLIKLFQQQFNHSKNTKLYIFFDTYENLCGFSVM